MAGSALLEGLRRPGDARRRGCAPACIMAASPAQRLRSQGPAPPRGWQVRWRVIFLRGHERTPRPETPSQRPPIGAIVGTREEVAIAVRRHLNRRVPKPRLRRLRGQLQSPVGFPVDAPSIEVPQAAAVRRTWRGPRIEEAGAQLCRADRVVMVSSTGGGVPGMLGKASSRWPFWGRRVSTAASIRQERRRWNSAFAGVDFGRRSCRNGRPLPHLQAARFEIDIGPAQAEQFGEPQPGEDGGQYQRAPASVAAIRARISAGEGISCSDLQFTAPAALCGPPVAYCSLAPRSRHQPTPLCLRQDVRPANAHQDVADHDSRSSPASPTGLEFRRPRHVAVAPPFTLQIRRGHDVTLEVDR